MKKLELVNNLERAKIIAQLFPEQMPTMVQAIKNYCQYVVDNEQAVKDGWNNGFISFEWWLNLCKALLKAIESNKKGIDKKVGWFTDQLFDGYLAIVSGHALIILAKDKDTHPKLQQAITLFFD